jgi:UDP-N-acetylmuramate dehydrogenase
MMKENFDLQAYNTFGLSAKAEFFDEFTSVDELDGYLKHNRNRELLVIGGGSNILLTKNITGLVLKNNLKGIEVVNETPSEVIIKASAGETWHDLVLFSIENNYGGIENLSLIPGSVGAAPMQNIGAYGVEIKDVFKELEAYEIATGEIHVFTNKDCQFGYRESIFKRELKGKYVILSVSLRLNKSNEVNTSYGAIETRLKEMGISSPTIKDVSAAVIHIRKSKLPDPAEIGNSGSFFKNPVVNKEKFESLKKRYPALANYPIDENNIKLAAGWLIDNAGWKGKTLGNYGVHKDQALVLVNYGGATGSDIYQLSRDILASIKDLYDIELEREVNVI